jgi:MoxR-like ATPase
VFFTRFRTQGPPGPLGRGKAYIPHCGISHGMQSVRGSTKQDSRKTLYEFLQENGFYVDHTTADLLEKIVTSSARKAVLLRGPAGVGKTQLTWLVAQWLNAEYVFFQCTYGTDEDALLYKYVPSESTRSGIKIALGPVPRALKISQRKKVVLVLDEFDKTRPSADALLLDVLQNYRLSLYLGDDNETIITGNPDNLIVFLTSNDMREFSEPLLRRLVVITLNPLPSSVVFELLKKRFKENIALLLAQIYEDTLKASLRKPATIQELMQLGEILESGVNAQLQDLIRTFIVKYDDDWVKFIQYVSSREPYKFVNGNTNSIDVTQYYEPPQEVQEVQIPQPQSQVQTQGQSTAQLLEKISKIVVRQVNASVTNAVKEEISGTIETSFKATLSENDITNYSEIIKTLMPTPSDVPDVFGKFKVIKDVSEYAIVTDKPLSLAEYVKLLQKRSITFEGYIEDELLIFNPIAINYLIKNASEVRYYTNHTIQVVFRDERGNITEAVEVKLLDGKYDPRMKIMISKVKVRAYVKAGNRENGYKSLLYDFVNDVVCNVTVKGETNVNAESLAKYAGHVYQLLNNGTCGNFSITVQLPANFTEDDVKKIYDVLTQNGFRVKIIDDVKKLIEKIIKTRSIRFYYGSYDDAIGIAADW